jgi:hypothetical protein
MDSAIINRAHPLAIGASGTGLDVLAETDKTQPVKNADQRQHGTKDTEKPVFEKHADKINRSKRH